MNEAQTFSINSFPGDGVQTVFEISFAGGYISQEHVKAYVSRLGFPDVPVEIEFTGPNTIIAPATPVGSDLIVYRDTPKAAPIADFGDGAILTEASLDINAKQAVFLAQEALDGGTTRLDGLETLTIKSPAGGVVTAGFVVVTPSGTAVGQDFLNVVKTATPVYDDGSWGGVTNSDGAWG